MVLGCGLLLDEVDRLPAVRHGQSRGTCGGRRARPSDRSCRARGPPARPCRSRSAGRSGRSPTCRGAATPSTWGSFSIAAVAAVTAVAGTAAVESWRTTWAFGRFASGNRWSSTSTAACESVPGIAKTSRNGLPAGAAATINAIRDQHPGAEHPPPALRREATDAFEPAAGAVGRLALLCRQEIQCRPRDEPRDVLLGHRVGGVDLVARPSTWCSTTLTGRPGARAARSRMSTLSSTSTRS